MFTRLSIGLVVWINLSTGKTKPFSEEFVNINYFETEIQGYKYKIKQTNKSAMTTLCVNTIHEIAGR